MKHTLQLLFILTVLAFASCKPGDHNQNPVPSNLLSGYLTVARQLDLDSPVTKYTEQAWAAFFMHPYEQPSDTMHLVVDSVRLNNFNVALDNTTKMYRASAAYKANNTCNWQVWSSTNIASFAYDFATPYPYYPTKLPDTIDRSMGLSITLPTGIDSATISLSANTQLFDVYKGGSGSFSATQLGTLNAGNATLEVVGYKVTMQAFGGKNFRFTKMSVKTKPVVLL